MYLELLHYSHGSDRLDVFYNLCFVIIIIIIIIIKQLVTRHMSA